VLTELGEAGRIHPIFESGASRVSQGES
jgi:hypothetical protein